MDDKGKDRSKQSVLVTGASSGIGKAIALGLDEIGFVVIAGVRREEDLRALKSQATGRLRPIILDITRDDHLSAAAAIMDKELGQTELVGLVNNAGICVTGPLEFVSRSAMQHQLDVNTISQLAVIQTFLPFLRKSRGRVVNIGSTSGRIAETFSGPYCASKFALEAITATLRLELEPSGIHVSIVEPGVVSTALWDKVIVAEDKLVQSMPEEGRVRYGEKLKKRRARLVHFSDAGRSADNLLRAVTHALVSTRPKDRYIIGFDAKLRIAAVRVLPRNVRNWLAEARRGMTRSN